MKPESARCRPAPPSRPPALILLESVDVGGSDQPVLPWDSSCQLAATEPRLQPQLRALASSLCSALVEVMAGRRSPLQLEGWADPNVLGLAERICRTGRGEGLALVSLRLQAPHSEAIEVTAHLQQAGRARAAALRITHRRGGWVATHLVLSLRPPAVHRAGWFG